MKVDNEFIRRYTGVVECIVRQYGKVNNKQDLMQEGFIGLMEAAKRYDPSTGVRFESYASWWVRKYIREHIIRYGQAVSLPSNTKDIFEHITEDIDATRYEEDGDVITFADCIADETDTDEEREQQQFERLHKAIEELPKREQIIIRQMYGIDCEAVPMKEVAKRIGLSYDRVKKIHARSVKFLHDAR
ncbi:MAG: sigma-70 family RNA polymerase sigma factor [Paludibacteraceae bacterium]|nr:sigma-70 family RNA polymerase sigma factor [Paludibacteraceae bacterium]